MNGEIKYAIIMDELTMSVLFLISYKDNDIDKYIYTAKIYSEVKKTEFVSNLLSRDANFTDKLYCYDRYCGWSISKIEYDRVKRLIETAPFKKEFESLAKYP